jgi:hypothetical protein
MLPHNCGSGNNPSKTDPIKKAFPGFPGEKFASWGGFFDKKPHLEGRPQDWKGFFALGETITWPESPQTALRCPW